MSVKAMSWVFEHSPYTLGTRLVHLAIADVANEDHGMLLWMSKARIAAKAKVSPPTVTAAFKTMVADGYLEEVEPASDGKTGTYRFLMPAATPQKSEGSDATPQIDTTGPPKTTDPHHLLTQEETQGGALTDPEDRSHPDYGFVRFWEKYPRRDGKRGNKKQALAIWRRMNYERKSEAWRQLQEYIEIVTAGRPAMDAQRWLRIGQENGWDPAEGWRAPGAGSPDRPRPAPAPERGTLTRADMARRKGAEDRTWPEFVTSLEGLTEAEQEQERRARRDGLKERIWMTTGEVPARENGWFYEESEAGWKKLASTQEPHPPAEAAGSR